MFLVDGELMNKDKALYALREKVDLIIDRIRIKPKDYKSAYEWLITNRHFVVNVLSSTVEVGKEKTKVDAFKYFEI